MNSMESLNRNINVTHVILFERLCVFNSKNRSAALPSTTDQGEIIVFSEGFKGRDGKDIKDVFFWQDF